MFLLSTKRSLFALANILRRHCVGDGESEHGGDSEGGESGGASSSRCETQSRDYDVGLRVGLLFVILATSGLGVFGPILLHRWMPNKLNLVFVVLKQFGTGIIISTALIHVRLAPLSSQDNSQVNIL